MPLDPSGSQGESTAATEHCDEEALPESSPSLLLSRKQLLSSLQSLLGELPLTESDLPADTRTTSFIHAATHRASSDWVRQLTRAAPVAAAARVSLGLESLLPCKEEDYAPACSLEFLENFLTRAFRRELSPGELQRFSVFLDEQVSTYGLEEGVALLLEAVILSPAFLYRFEADRHDVDAQGMASLDPSSLAVRLSYFLTGGPPDDELLELARSEAILQDDELEAQARRLLEEKGAAGAVLFFQNWFGLDFEQITKGRELMDGVASQEELNAGWKEMFAALIRQSLAESDGSFEDLLGSPVLSVPESLTAVYSLDAPRAGLLTQPGVLAALSHDHSSPVLRGVFIRDHLLCQPVPPPPPGVEANIPEASIAKTTRERYANLEQDPGCKNCHRLIHPIGFGLEAYDALGRFRTSENGQELDTSGQLVGFSDPQLSGDFVGAQELGRAIAGSSQFAECLTVNLYEAGLARAVGAFDACRVREIAQQVGEARNFKELVVAFVQSSAFKKRVAKKGAMSQ